MQTYVAYCIIFITFTLLFYFILNLFISDKKLIGVRLGKIEKPAEAERENELDKPLLVRLIHPILDNISRIIINITPKGFTTMIEKRIIKAGKPYGFSVKDWVNIQAAVLLCLPLVTTTAAYYVNVEFNRILTILMLEVMVGTLLPNLILNRKIMDRQKQIINSMPDILDLLTVSVEAGLGFDGALAKVIEKMPGPLADEFNMALHEIKVGKQKRDALREMAERIDVQDLTTFIGSIVQAEQLGVSIGNVLRLQAEQIRQKRRQRAQEKAMKAPIKMLVPMVLFIFPTIFSVLLGPVVIKVIRTLMK